ncbi:MAG TPA: glycosyl transferase, partial [Streptomyces sp.]|nr:glycosyl transferase [Streptomyces sp.]
PGGGFGEGGGMRGGMQLPPGAAGQQGNGPQGNGPQGGAQQGGGRPGGATPPTGASNTPGAAAEGAARGGGGGMGGLLNGQNVSAEVEARLTADADDFTWTAAAIGAQNAASYQLATEKPVMAIGGFNGSDPSPTLEQFKEYVKDGKIHYFLASSGGSGGGGRGGEQGGGGPGGSSSSAITTWIEANFTKVTVDGTTLYDLTSAT